MGGHVLESWKDEMIRIGRTEGRAEAHQEIYQKLIKKVQTKLLKGKSVAQIAEELEEEESLIREICKELEK